MTYVLLAKRLCLWTVIISFLFQRNLHIQGIRNLTQFFFLFDLVKVLGMGSYDAHIFKNCAATSEKFVRSLKKYISLDGTEKEFLYRTRLESKAQT